MRFTPLNPDAMPLLAPDTQRRLRAFIPEDGRVAFLATLYTREPGGVLFEPRSVMVDSQGRRYLPAAIRALSPGWGGRVEQDRPLEALYLFEADLDLNFPLVLEAGGARNDQWGGILIRLDTERARVRARSRGGDRAGPSDPLQ